MGGYFRDIDGEMPATIEYRELSRKARRRSHLTNSWDAGEPLLLEYDDGNGMWISQEETPSDLG